MFGKDLLQQKSRNFFRAVETPSSLVDVLDIDEASEVDPSEVGFTQGDVNIIWSAVEDLYRTGMYPGMSFCIRRNGKILLNRSLGVPPALV